VQIAIAGAHGQIAQKLTPILAQRGESVVGLIRNPDHAEDVRGLGAEPVLCDLERESVEAISHAITGCDAAVFAAGAGPGSGTERKLTVDRDGAVKLLEAASAAQVPRFLIVSAVGAEDPPGGDEVFAVYLRAKAQADAAVQASDRDWTIVRPGGLTDDAGSGRVRLEESPFRGEVPREDVAALLAALLRTPKSIGRILYVNSGEDTIADALLALG
jgi:nucleoside-diphosphate-sugar epimerase